jgi:peptidoglycan/LPS O-acetylase OafA/YrhL
MLGHLAMIGRPPDYDLDVPTWSLAHEMRISIIFPPLVFAVFRLGGLRALAVALALHIACMVGLRFVGDTTPLGTVLMTGSFVLLFVFGITLATHADIWQARLVGLSAGTRAVLWVASFAALIYPTFASDVPLIFGLGGLGIIALSLTSPRAQHLLSADPIMWLGRVSYSLYLVHLIVLEAAAHLLFGLVPLSVILLGAILVSLVCAHVAYHLIERPAIKLGQRLARREMRRAVILN